jgi:hypothetical protein
MRKDGTIQPCRPQPMKGGYTRYGRRRLRRRGVLVHIKVHFGLNRKNSTVGRMQLSHTCGGVLFTYMASCKAYYNLVLCMYLCT